MGRRGAERNERGAALILALLASVVIFILVMALSGTRLVELRAVSGNVQITQAQLLADAGVDYVLALIARDDLVLPSASPYYSVPWRPMNTGRYTATADLGPGGDLRITSTGEDARGVRRTVEVLLDLEVSGSAFPDYAIFTCGPLVLDGSMEVVDGNVYSGDTLEIQQNRAVQSGSAYARGRVTFNGTGSIDGNVVSVTSDILAEGNPNLRRAGAFAANPAGFATLNAPTQVQLASHDPELYNVADYCNQEGDLRAEFEVTAEDFDNYRAQAESESAAGCVEGDVTVSAGSANGYDPNQQRCIDGNMTIGGMPTGFAFENEIYYIDGDLTIDGNFELPGPVTFVVRGTLLVAGGAQVTSADFDNVFLVDGDAVIEGNSLIDGLVYTNGTIRGAGTPTINGAAIAMADEGGNGVTGNITVNYKSAATGSPISVVLPGFDIKRWRLVTSP